MRRLAARLLAWLPALLLSAGVGVAVFYYVRYHSPRCIIDGMHQMLHVSPDGALLATVALAETRETRGPIELWDTRSGRSVAAFASDARHLRCERWRIRQWLVASDDAGTLHIIDWARQEAHTVPTGKPLKYVSIDGPWCIATSQVGDKMLIDLRTPEIVQRFPPTSECHMGWAGERWLFEQQPDKIQIWDLERMQVDGILAGACEEIWSVRARWLPAWHKGVWTLWDWRTRTKLPHRLLAGRREVQLSAAGDLVAFVENNHEQRSCRLHVLETESGREVLTRSVPYGANEVQFSAKSKLLCVVGAPELSGLTMFDLATGEQLWQTNDLAMLLPNADLVHARGAGGARLLDARTGKHLSPANVEGCELTSDLRLLIITSNKPASPWHSWLGKLLPAAFGEGRHISLVQMSDGRELFSVRRSKSGDWRLSEDGTTLVNETRAYAEKNLESTRIDVWDVSPQRAWLWAAASAGATAGAVLLFSRWRKRRSPPRAVAERPSPRPV